MALPQPAEYDEALQNPAIGFLDPELKVAWNDGPLRCGIPGPVASGNFAIVYRFKTNSRRFAVKCFTRGKSDQGLRYSLISSHLKNQALPWTIECRYLPRGVLVKGKAYPILLMEWLENSETLLSYISKAVQQGIPLGPLCDQFLTMSKDLRTAKIAHGDLQHGNLMVSDGKLRIIDYDGMCVPETLGFPSEEDGLADYQHPSRNGGVLSYTIDNFPILVIWTSLYALCLDPTLWERRVGSDERLLFKKSDFLSPQSSSLFAELRSYNDSKMSLVLETLSKACINSSPSTTPHVVDVIPNISGISSGHWWKSADTTPAKSTGMSQAISSNTPSWMIQTETCISKPLAFEKPTIGVGLAAALWGALTLISFLVLAVDGANGLVGFGSLLASAGLGSSHLWMFFTRSKPYKQKLELFQALAILDGEIRNSTKVISLAESPFQTRIIEAENGVAVHSSRVLILEKMIQKRTEQCSQEIAKAGNVFTQSMDQDETQLAAKIRELCKMKDDLLVKFISSKRIIEENYRITESNINAKIISASQSAAAKKKIELQAFIEQELSTTNIGSCRVSGVNCNYLRAAGFNTANDFTAVGQDGSLRNKNNRYIKVRGIGNARASDLLGTSWHLVVE